MGGWKRKKNIERDWNNGRRGREAREIVEERKRCIHIYIYVCVSQEDMENSD